MLARSRAIPVGRIGQPFYGWLSYGAEFRGPLQRPFFFGVAVEAEPEYLER
jgi:hypothetical protein